MTDTIADLLKSSPPLGHRDRAEWNRRLDAALADGAERVAALARLARGEAVRRGDMTAALTAGTVERRARKLVQAGRE